MNTLNRIVQAILGFLKATALVMVIAAGAATVTTMALWTNQSVHAAIGAPGGTCVVSSRASDIGTNW